MLLNYKTIIGLQGWWITSLEKKFKYKILGKDEDLKQIFKKYKSALVTIGFIKDYEKRLKTFKKLKKIGFNLNKKLYHHLHISRQDHQSEKVQ